MMVSSMLTRTVYLVPDQPELHSEILSPPHLTLVSTPSTLKVKLIRSFPT